MLRQGNYAASVYAVSTQLSEVNSPLIWPSPSSARAWPGRPRWFTPEWPYYDLYKQEVFTGWGSSRYFHRACSSSRGLWERWHRDRGGAWLVTHGRHHSRWRRASV